MNIHSPEPWFLLEWANALMGGTGTIASITEYRGDPQIIATIYPSNKELHKANARRIVACVNACAGLSTEELEQGKVQGVDALVEGCAEAMRVGVVLIPKSEGK